MDKALIEQELAELGKFQTGHIIGDKWKILSKLDEGGFGCVYKVQNLKDQNLAALKVERANNDEINYLKLETAVLKELHANKMQAHVPELFRSARKKHYCYIIITLLGENLRRLKDKYFPKGMPLRTWTRVGVQCLVGIKTMHDRGYIHRDIKAQNFVLGCSTTPAVARVVYIIDFGLARAYAYPPTKTYPKWIPRKARARLEFRGTFRYASPAMHEEKEQGRKDDLWSWLYMMIDLYCNLPWQEKDNKNAIEVKKLHMRDDDLMIKMPEETKFIPKHLRSLDMYQRPDYMRIHAALDSIRKKYKASYEDSYEWESKTAAESNRKAMKGKTAPILYTAADEFFKSDPVGIGKAPTSKEEKEIMERFKKTELIMMKDDVITTPKPIPSPGKTSATSPGTTTTSPLDRDRELKSKFGTRLPSTRPDKKTVKQKKRNSVSKQSKKEVTSEDSVDFVPSCYMNFDVPLHYLTAQNQQTKDFQKKVASMDWGHAEPQKHFKDALSPLKAPPPPQQESSGQNSSDNSRRVESNRSDNSSNPNRSDNSSNPKVDKPPGSIIQNTLTDDPTQLKKDCKSVMKTEKKKKEEPESSTSNKSVSLAGHIPGYYNPRQKKK